MADIDRTLERVLREAKAARDEARSIADDLNFGGGGGTSGGMEARLASLEAHMEHVRTDSAALKSDVSSLKTGIATLTERVAHLPSKGFIVTALGIGLGLLGALSLFGPNLRAFLGL